MNIEKMYIILNKEDNLLNRRKELISKCRHTNKFMIKKYLSNYFILFCFCSWFRFVSFRFDLVFDLVLV